MSCRRKFERMAWDQVISLPVSNRVVAFERHDPLLGVEEIGESGDTVLYGDPVAESLAEELGCNGYSVFERDNQYCAATGEYFSEYEETSLSGEYSVAERRPLEQVVYDYDVSEFVLNLSGLMSCEDSRERAELAEVFCDVYEERMGALLWNYLKNTGSSSVGRQLLADLVAKVPEIDWADVGLAIVS